MVSIVAAILIVPAVLLGDTTNIFTPTVSYQYTEGACVSPVVSYQYPSGILMSPAVSFSYSEGMSFARVVSYQYPSGILMSPTVSFSYSDGISFARVVSYQFGEGVAFSPVVSYYYQFVLDSVGDGIPDLWRARYFGGYGTTTNSLSCAIADPSGTGQNNLFKYIAGLDPTNPASVFVLRIAGVPGWSSRSQLVFSPRWSDRTYVPICCTNLFNGTWPPLTNTSAIDNDAERTITDLNASESAKFYRVQISYP
jgi:hypothetical protein